MEEFKLEKPDLSKVDRQKVLQAHADDPSSETVRMVVETIAPEYLYWDEVRYKTPRPDDLNAEEFWQLVKIVRMDVLGRKKTPIRTPSGAFFTHLTLPGTERLFHEIDLDYGGTLLGLPSDIGEEQKQLLLTRGLTEEAIASAQLEGASTTRPVAKKIIQEGRKPSTVSEQMILNKYLAMVDIEEEYRHRPMDRDMLFRLHARLVRDTNVPPDRVGRLREDGDDIVVANDTGTQIYYRCPPVAFVRAELDRLIAYANDGADDDEFTHPLLRAIILHFWVGFLHPFTDGNGRLARAVFYWYLLRKGYWAFSYLPISTVLKRAPAQYRKAYIYSEQDDNDLTYFLDFHLRKIRQARTDFIAYVRKMREESSRVRSVLVKSDKLNERQVQLLRYFLHDASSSTSIATHMHLHKVSRMTAIKDLGGLVKKGYLKKSKEGRMLRFFATERVRKNLAKQ